MARPPTLVDFSDESDSNERVPDKTEMARLKRRSRADQDQDQDQDQDGQPISTMTTARPVAKKRKTTSGAGTGLTLEEREKMARTSERLKKDAQRLPVNEGELESLVFVIPPLFLSGERDSGHWNRMRVVFICLFVLILIPIFSSISTFPFASRHLVHLYPVILIVASTGPPNTNPTPTLDLTVTVHPPLNMDLNLNRYR